MTITISEPGEALVAEGARVHFLLQVSSDVVFDVTEFVVRGIAELAC